MLFPLASLQCRAKIGLAHDTSIGCVSGLHAQQMMLVAASSDQKAGIPHKQMSTVFHPIHALDGATKIDNPKLCSLRLLAS